ncbi:MAG: aromatic amino acid lyase, partial [Methanomassiliicoccales archaeon]|nr:aromatic amino acid lyase [Methanomassiliicoccales archaeon]
MRVELSGKELGIDDLEAVALGAAEVSLEGGAEARIQDARAKVEAALERGRVVYGLNTGVGELRTVVIPKEDITQLQCNLVRSSACAVGEPLAEEVVRGMMMLRANAFATGRSGVRPELVRLLIGMLNSRVHPVVPHQGSVGSSGDLAPLAHVALVVMGEGEAWYQGRRVPGGEALRAAGLSPLRLQAKEGLALINGTQMMTALAGLGLARALRA